MAADATRPDPPDRICISTNYELRYWADKFTASPDRLKAVIHRVGSSLIAVQQARGATRCRSPRFRAGTRDGGKM
jgi:hypothetical protein